MWIHMYCCNGDLTDDVDMMWLVRDDVSFL